MDEASENALEAGRVPTLVAQIRVWSFWQHHLFD
jgi:hypothetical protein